MSTADLMRNLATSGLGIKRKHTYRDTCHRLEDFIKMNKMLVNDEDTLIQHVTPFSDNMGGYTKKGMRMTEYVK